MSAPTRWVTDNPEDHSAAYVERFRKLAADGADLAGEARLVDAMARPGSRILDAGCGPGRVGAVLQARGHTVVGVDADPVLIAAAEQDHPAPTWLVADLAELDLAAAGQDQLFDAVVMAGNVMPFLAPGTETRVLQRLLAHLVTDGFAVVGFGLERGYPLSSFDQHLAEAGFQLEQRFSTWDLRPWQPDSAYAVTVLRRP